jgi:hypothetical protein
MRRGWEEVEGEAGKGGCLSHNEAGVLVILVSGWCVAGECGYSLSDNLFGVWWVATKC